MTSSVRGEIRVKTPDTCTLNCSQIACLIFFFFFYPPLHHTRAVTAMLGKVRSDWSSPGLVILQEVCPLSSAITFDFCAPHGLSLECPSPRLVASTSYRVQSTRPVAPGWEYTWPLHMDLLRPGRWLCLAAHPPSGAV